MLNSKLVFIFFFLCIDHYYGRPDSTCGHYIFVLFIFSFFLYGIGEAIIFSFCGFFLSFFLPFFLPSFLPSFFPRLMSAVADWMSTILLHMV